MSEVKIRDFVLSDVQAVTGLTKELGYPSTEEEMNVRMKKIIDNPLYRTLIAVKEEEVVGYCGIFLYDCWEHNEPILRVEVLVVKTEARRYGIGKVLMEKAEQWARERGASIISLNSGNRAERESAHKFYPSLGFEARSIGYSKRLS